jgi:hypothetical protein
LAKLKLPLFFFDGDSLRSFRHDYDPKRTAKHPKTVFSRRIFTECVDLGLPATFRAYLILKLSPDQGAGFQRAESQCGHDIRRLEMNSPEVDEQGG